MKVAPAATQVRYTTETDSVTVDRLLPENVTRRTAAQVLKLVIAAYEHEFEPPWFDTGSSGKPLQPTTVREQYATGGAVFEREQLMRRRLENGGAYWVVRASEDASYTGEFASLANTTPSRATLLQRFGPVQPNCYLGNVITHPIEQGQGLGSMAMHAAVKYGGYNPRRLVVADVLTDNVAGVQFFEIRGLQQETGIAVSPLEFPGGQELAQARFSGQLGNVIEALEARMPVLQSAEVIA